MDNIESILELLMPMFTVVITTYLILHLSRRRLKKNDYIIEGNEINYIFLAIIRNSLYSFILMAAAGRDIIEIDSEFIKIIFIVAPVVFSISFIALNLLMHTEYIVDTVKSLSNDLRNLLFGTSIGVLLIWLRILYSIFKQKPLFLILYLSALFYLMIYSSYKFMIFYNSRRAKIIELITLENDVYTGSSIDYFEDYIVLNSIKENSRKVIYKHQIKMIEYKYYTKSVKEATT